MKIHAALATHVLYLFTILGDPGVVCEGKEKSKWGKKIGEERVGREFSLILFLVFSTVVPHVPRTSLPVTALESPGILQITKRAIDIITQPDKQNGMVQDLRLS